MSPTSRRSSRNVLRRAQVAPEPRALVETLEGPVVGEYLLEEVVAATGAEGDVEAEEAALLDEAPHPRVGEPQVLPRDEGAGLPGATCMQKLAAAGAGDHVLALTWLAGEREATFGVRADGGVGDLGGAGGALDGCGHCG